MEGIELNIFNELIKLGPIVLILGIVIYWLAKRVEKKEEEIRELNKTLIDLQLKNIEIMKEINNSIEQITKELEYINKK